MWSSRTFRPSDYRTMAWKNGQGSTTELVVEPPGSALDEFHWRLSIAELRASGPFSTFAGYDRVIVQLDGPPMTLTHAGCPPVTLSRLAPHAFSGDDETTCAVSGVAHDFNLMVRREVARATLAVRVLGDGDALSCEGPTTALYVLEGSLEGSLEGPLCAGDTRVEAGRSAYRARGPTVALTATISPSRR